MSGIFQPRFMPCPACGASCDRAELGEHACDPERFVDFAFFQLRHEVALLQEGVWSYLESARGRFELWYAERQRGRSD